MSRKQSFSLPEDLLVENDTSANISECDHESSDEFNDEFLLEKDEFSIEGKF